MGRVRTIRSDEPIADDGPAPADHVAAAGSARVLRSRYLLSATVLVVVAAISAASFLGLRTVVHNQERRLLNERATELVAYLKAASAQTSATLAAAGEAVAIDGGSSRLFTSLATPLARTGATVAVVQRSGPAFATVAAVGSAAAVGRPLTPVQGAIAARAARSTGLAFEVAKVQRVNHFLEALRVPGATPTVVLFEGPLSRPTPIPSKQDSPFRELDVALYAGTRPVSDRLVLISGAIPKPADHPVSKIGSVGADKILVVTAGHGPLVGSVAQVVPGIALAGGLVLAVLLALLVQVLTRRRAYALNLVGHRTRAMYQAQMAAEAANRSKSDFLSRMSHELRTPLNAVLGFSQLLELDELTPDQEQAVGQITKGGRHLLDLINEILDISQIETGTLAMSPEPVNVGALVAETVDLIGPLATERGVHLFGCDLGACDAFIFADRQRLKQILFNLLGNGIKYNREGGTVSISCTSPTPEVLRIQIVDTGPGIPKEQFGLLFTPFERLGAERTTIEGTGIGLALSRRLTEVMGGTLGVESTVGRGSTFWVDFPVVEGPVERVERLGGLGGPAEIGRPGLDRPAVLHIEDNLSNIQLIERVLAQRPGVNLIPAMQGRLGVDLARQHQPALILLDLNLADIPGEEVLHLLRDDPVTAHIPVVIVSADAMPRQVQRLLAGGATAYLTKPIDVRQLLELIDRALEAHQRRDDPVGAGSDVSGG